MKRISRTVLPAVLSFLVSSAIAAPQWGEPVQAATEAVPTSDKAAVEHAIDKGDRVPDLSFKNAEGETVTLASELEKGPVVLIVYRGGWCPYCVKQLKAFNAQREAIEAAGGRVVAFSTETPKFVAQTRGKNKLGYTVLSDPGAAASRALGIAWKNEKYAKIGKIAAHQGNELGEIPLGATYVIDTDGVVRYAFLTDQYKTRATPEAVIEALAQIDG